ncbi:MAG: isoleucine--tRNA ligase [candidate division WS1 bacterium]|nr:isoleucine--tRNA ligase [candidate division WS1 bacterium]
MDYRPTLNLLETDFPMRANLPAREPELVRWWEEQDLYRRVREARAGAPVWLLHDGPPYANGNIHLGQALNKILKDIAIKYKTLRGFDCPYVPGWDTQGLPTELAVQREQGLNRHEVSVLEWRRRCRELALKYVDLQREQFKRLGVRGDWESPYLTLAPAYQARQIEAFGKIAGRGLVYRDLRPVYWCYHCETALAEDEVEYETKCSASIYVAFPLSNAAEFFPELPAGADAAVLIWTTTPWTIPGNTGIALSASAQYVLVNCGGKHYLLAEELLDPTRQEAELGECEVVARRPGAELVGLVARHPLYDRPSPLVLGEHVLMDQGTGAVHTAPGHGLEDYQVSREYGLPVLSPLDDYGCFTCDAGERLEGQVCDEANQEVIAMLKETGALLHAGEITHEYPHCWRCHLPVIYRATRQWFMDINQLRAAVLEEIGKASWMPRWGQARIAGMVEARPDWCISRQRTWGVPIPAFHCEACQRVLVSEEIANHIRDVVAASPTGADVWFEREAEELLPPGTVCPECGGARFSKEGDTMSVWVDSGVSHYTVLRTHPDLCYPADCYLEGDDQYQLWFQTSLWCAAALGEPAPFRLVVGHGFFVDETGQKMSKSKGNIVSPFDILDKYGADILRLWFTYADFRRKMFYSEAILEQVADAYRRIRNTLRFLLTNLQDFEPSTQSVGWEKLRELDRWALVQLGRLRGRVTEAFDNWDLHLYYHEVHSFCARELSAFYLDVLKDTLYTDLPDSAARRSAQTVMWQILQALTIMSAPVLTFTAEEVWQQARKLDPSLPLSVQMAYWPEASTDADPTWLARWDRLLEIREEVLLALEQAKAAGVVRKPLEAKVSLGANQQDLELLREYEEQLSELFIVSEVELRESAEGLGVSAERAEGEKCGRCWMRKPEVGREPDHPELCARCASRVRALSD